MSENRSRKILEKYQEELEADQQVDRIMLMDKLENLTKISHKWLYRWYQHQTLLADLVDRKEEVYAKLMADLELSDDPRLRGLSQAALKRKIDSSDVIRKINRKIKDEDRMIEYLDGVVNLFRYTMTKSCENLVKLIDLEERT